MVEDAYAGIDAAKARGNAGWELGLQLDMMLLM